MILYSSHIFHHIDCSSSILKMKMRLRGKEASYHIARALERSLQGVLCSGLCFPVSGWPTNSEGFSGTFLPLALCLPAVASRFGCLHPHSPPPHWSFTSKPPAEGWFPLTLLLSATSPDSRGTALVSSLGRLPPSLPTHSGFSPSVVFHSLSTHLTQPSGLRSPK